MVLSRAASLVHLPPASLHAHHHPRDRGVWDLGAAVFLECGAMGRSHTERNRFWYQYVFCGLRGRFGFFEDTADMGRGERLSRAERLS